MSIAHRPSVAASHRPSHWLQAGLRSLLVLAVLLGQAATQLHGYAHLADDLSLVAMAEASPEVNAEPAQSSSGHALGKCLQYHAAGCAMPGVPLLQLAADDASAPIAAVLQSVQARTELRYQSRAPPVLNS